MTENSTARVRASDAEREKFAELVRQAVGEGRLNINEGDERLLAVYAATYRDELRPLVADLPSAPPLETGPTRPDGAAWGYPGRRGQWGQHPDRWHGGHPMAPWGRRRGPWLPFGPLFVGGLLVLIWATTGAHFFWPAIPLFFLTMIVVRRVIWWRMWSRYREMDRSER